MKYCVSQKNSRVLQVLHPNLRSVSSASRICVLLTNISYSNITILEAP